MTNNPHTFSVLVENEFGVLARVASMFAGRGYNIDSLSVAPTLDPKYSLMMIVSTGSDHVIEQILKQLNRLMDVVKAEDLTRADYYGFETILVSVSVSQSEQALVLKVIEDFKATLVHQSDKTLILQLTGESEKVESCLKQLQVFKISKLVRTGTIAIPKE
ncbi:MAG: acetolactate synthase small subunit [Deltaproteobacteria bacterium]|nr:acetolactate synthase small subunit [Deltaproteobacteria bacterium]